MSRTEVVAVRECGAVLKWYAPVLFSFSFCGMLIMYRMDVQINRYAY